jgi:RNA polymerase primary sigma factor
MEATQHYLKSLKEIPALTREQEKNIAERIKKGDHLAKQELVNSNLRFVVKIANKYSGFHIPLLDLIEEGNLGLMEAVNRFDLKKGCRFSTYATWWVKHYILRFIITQSTIIKLPVYVAEKAVKLKKQIECLTQKLGREPTTEEIAKKMGIPVKRATELSRAIMQACSLDESMGEDNSIQLIDVVSNKHYDVSDAHPWKLVIREKLLLLLSQVNERERQILILRFGLGDGIPRTLSEMARKFNLSRERIRQIETSALKKMKNILKLEEEMLRIKGNA